VVCIMEDLGLGDLVLSSSNVVGLGILINFGSCVFEYDGNDGVRNWYFDI